VFLLERWVGVVGEFNLKKIRMGAGLVNEGWLVDNINCEVGTGCQLIL